MLNPVYELLGRLSHEPMLLSPTFTGIPAMVRGLLASQVTDADILADTALRFGAAGMPEAKPYAMIDQIAVVPVHGMLLNRFGGAWGIATGYDFIRNAVNAAVADPGVKGIVFDVNSSGGDAQGCFEACDVIRAAAEKKPMMALVNANAMSGAFAIATATGNVAVVPSARVGSVGVVTMHVDYSKALEEEGVKVTFVYAGDHKIDGNAYQPLPKSVKDAMQSRVDSLYSAFVAQVARDRRMSEESIRSTEAAVYDAEEARRLGLIDRIADSATAFSAFMRDLSPMTLEAQPMNDTVETIEAAPAVEAPAAAAPVEDVAATVAAAERERVAAILGCDEAGQRQTLAKHLAFRTSLSLDDARQMLAVAALEAPVKVDSPFVAAMDADDHPEVGVSEGTSVEPAPNSAAAILRDYAAATGRKSLQ